MDVKAGNLPPIWVTWLVLGLIHYLKRKKWAWAIYQTRLAKTITLEALHAEDAMQPLPDLPEWAFKLDGNNSAIISSVTGENIHFDPSNGYAFMNIESFRRYLQEYRTPGPAEQRLNELFPSGKGILAGLNYLWTHDALHWVFDPMTPDMKFKICLAMARYSEPVEDFLNAWQEPRYRLRLGAVIGDWDVVAHAAELKNEPQIAARAKLLAADARDRWLDRLRKLVEFLICDDALYALATAKADDLPSILKTALNNSALAEAAIEIAGNDATWRA